MHDILIMNGTIVDGTGKKQYRSDIAINDGVITEVGDLSGDKARDLIDAKNLIVAPGFIDFSNRSDTRWRLFQDPQLESLLHQGITTIIGGNSGSSLAPIYNEDMANVIRKWIDISRMNVGWHSVKEFFGVVEEHGLSVNFGTFVGYGTLRRGIVGDESRALTKIEQKSINKHIEESLKQGALGISTGLIYSHERDILIDELIDVAKIVSKHKKIFVTHLRNEDSELVEAVDEAIHIQKETGVRMHISHLKAMGKKNWSLMEEVIKKIEKTDIIFDIYPYTLSTAVLYTLLPDWISDGGRRMLLERLKNKKLRTRVMEDMKKGPDLSRAIVLRTKNSDYFCGKTMEQIAKSQNSSVHDAAIDVLLASEGQASVLLNDMSEENIIRGLESSHSVLSSNGAGYTIGNNSGCMEHPRSFGAFPRAYNRYVNQNKNISIEEFVHKSTGKVAEELNIDDRGLIQQGKIADISIFDGSEFFDNATVEQPYQYASGIKTLIVNGQVALKYGRYTGIRSGKIIKE